MLSAFWHGFYLGYFYSFFFWGISLFVNRYFYKADVLYPRFYRLYVSLGVFGHLLAFMGNKICFNLFGLYFQILSSENILRILKRTYGLPELGIILIYFILMTTGAKGGKGKGDKGDKGDKGGKGAEDKGADKVKTS
jgi:lysophospholipid acyltransferase